MEYTIQVEVDDMVHDDLQLVERMNVTYGGNPYDLVVWAAEEASSVGDELSYYVGVWRGHDASPALNHFAGERRLARRMRPRVSIRIRRSVSCA